MIFQEKLIDWYHKNHRRLPWRETRDPYKIWLSEIMCQQTQVATVVDYYNRFLQAYPTINDLVKASEDEVYKLWEGLGYYSRAKRLMLCARAVVGGYNGLFPKDYEQIIKLPGIGPYTAGAILSIAYEVKEPAIDGNVMRVYSRIYNLSYDVAKPNARKLFDPYLRADLPEDISAFNQGLMELGARICTPTKPRCHECPISESCIAYDQGIQLSLPVKTPKKKKRVKNILVAFIEVENEILIEKRGTEGLLANLWGLPAAEYDIDNIDEFTDWIKDNYGQDITYDKEMLDGRHIFTHLIWNMKLVKLKCRHKTIIDDPIIEWVSLDELDTYPLPTAFKKLISQVEQRNFLGTE